MFGVVMGNKAWQVGREEAPPGPRREATGEGDSREEAVDGAEPDGAEPVSGPAAGHQCTLTFAALPSTPRWARALARDALSGWGMESYADTVELLLSELVTNAVKAGGPKAVIRIAIRAADGRLRIEVADGATGRPRVDTPGPDTESGRGLLLVSEISADWGTYPVRPGSGTTGKVVWCEIAAGNAGNSAEDFAEEPAGEQEAG